MKHALGWIVGVLSAVTGILGLIGAVTNASEKVWDYSLALMFLIVAACIIPPIPKFIEHQWKVVSRKHLGRHWQLKFILGSFLALVFVASIQGTEEQTEVPVIANASPVTQCLSVPQAKIDAINEGIEKGVTLRNAQAVKSKAFQNVYFISGDLDGVGLEGHEDIATFASNSLELGGSIMAVDAVAKEFSDWADGGNTKFEVDINDDGASQSAGCVGKAGAAANQQDSALTYQIVYTVPNLRNGTNLYVLLDPVDISNANFKDMIKATVRKLVKEHGQNISLEFHDQKDSLKTSYKQYGDFSLGRSRTEAETAIQARHFIALFEGQLENNSFFNTLSFFPAALKNAPDIGIYVESIEFNP